MLGKDGRYEMDWLGTAGENRWSGVGGLFSFRFHLLHNSKVRRYSLQVDGLTASELTLPSYIHPCELCSKEMRGNPN